MALTVRVDTGEVSEATGIFSSEPKPLNVDAVLALVKHNVIPLFDGRQTGNGRTRFLRTSKEE